MTIFASGSFRRAAFSRSRRRLLRSAMSLSSGLIAFAMSPNTRFGAFSRAIGAVIRCALRLCEKANDGAQRAGICAQRRRLVAPVGDEDSDGDIVFPRPFAADVRGDAADTRWMFMKNAMPSSACATSVRQGSLAKRRVNQYAVALHVAIVAITVSNCDHKRYQQAVTVPRVPPSPAHRQMRAEGKADNPPSCVLPGNGRESVRGMRIGLPITEAALRSMATFLQMTCRRDREGGVCTLSLAFGDLLVQPGIFTTASSCGKLPRKTCRLPRQWGTLREVCGAFCLG